jgi:hypothetical protein
MQRRTVHPLNRSPARLQEGMPPCLSRPLGTCRSQHLHARYVVRRSAPCAPGVVGQMGAALPFVGHAVVLRLRRHLGDRRRRQPIRRLTRANAGTASRDGRHRRRQHGATPCMLVHTDAHGGARRCHVLNAKQSPSAIPTGEGGHSAAGPAFDRRTCIFCTVSTNTMNSAKSISPELSASTCGRRCIFYSHFYFIIILFVPATQRHTRVRA